MQFLQAVRKGVGELNRGMLIVFEEVSEVQLVVSLSFFFASVVVADIDAAPSPLGLAAVPIAHLHAIIVQAPALGKALNCEPGLALYSLYREVKPTVPSR